MLVVKLIRNTLIAGMLALCLPSVVFADSIAVTVNEFPITNDQISMRARLLRLERRGSNDSQRLGIARSELVDEQLKIQDGQRLGIAVSENEVNDAFLNIARNMRISTDNLNRALQQGGVNPDTVRARLKAQIVWNKISQSVISGRVEFSEVELEQRAADNLSEADSIDYILKEIRFIIPAGSNISESRRTAEANQYRASFQGCDTAIELSLSYTDAAVINVGRRHATQLPDQVSEELAGLNVGQLTRPRVASGGVSMVAICEKTVARDLTFVTGEERQKVGTELLQKASEAYLKELRDDADIVNR